LLKEIFVSKRRPKSKPKGGAAAPAAPIKPRFPSVALWAAFSVVILAAMGLYALFGGRGGAETAVAYPAEISVEEAVAKREAGAFILDVREQFEWDESHIPDATLIPLSQLASRINEIPADQEIVVVCRSGNRSQDGRDILKAYGFEQVSSMSGGMLDWRSAGYPAQSAAQPIQ
jgi:rhodanese-related sulfurtransferase